MKNALGKGLSALVNEQLQTDGGQTIEKVAIDSVHPGRYQPRKEFTQEQLSELAESITEYGILQPLIVTPRKDGEGYELIAGERRLRAAKSLDFHEIPVIVRDFEERDLLAIALVENLQREDLNPIEVAEAYFKLCEQLDITQEQLSRVVGKSRSAVANSLRLLKLPAFVRKQMLHGALSEGHGRTLLALNNPDLISAVVEEINKDGLSVRETEMLVQEINKQTKAPVTKSEPTENPRVQVLEDKLVRSLGLKAKVKGSPNKGSLQVYYNTPEELEVLVRRITG